jgi:hypothetical protein
MQPLRGVRGVQGKKQGAASTKALWQKDGVGIKEQKELVREILTREQDVSGGFHPDHLAS